VERGYDPLRAPHLIHVIVDNGYSHGFSKNLFLSIAKKRLFGKTKTAEPSWNAPGLSITRVGPRRILLLMEYLNDSK
jgi:hypothetical protein